MRIGFRATLAVTLVVAACSDAADLQAPSVTFQEVGVVTSATGSAHTQTAGELRVTVFTANKLADGTVSGEFTIDILALDARWRTSVECLTVVGNRAFIGGTIVDTNHPIIQVGTKSYFWVDDAGPGSDQPDRVSLAGVNETQEGMDDFCGLVQNLLPGQDVLQGNVRVSG